MVNEQEYQSQTFTSEKTKSERYKSIESISFEPISKYNFADKVKTKGEIRWFKLFWLIPIYKYEVSENHYRHFRTTYTEHEFLEDNKNLFIKDGEIYRKAVVEIRFDKKPWWEHYYFDTNEEAKASMDEEIKKCKKYGNNLV